MAGAFDVLKEVMTLTSNVADLKDQVKSAQTKLENHHERIVKLESREELIIEKCRNAAIETVSQNTIQMTKDIMNLSNDIKKLGSGS